MKLKSAGILYPRRHVWCMVFGITALSLPATADDGVVLKGDVEPGLLRRVSAKLNVDGQLSVPQDGKAEKLKLTVAGQLRYDERILDFSPNHGRSVRHYDQADAEIRIDRSIVSPKLREECRLIGAETGKSGLSLFSPRTPLNREELDLIDYPGCSLLLPTLLPTERVRAGVEWQHENNIWVGLLRLDAVGSNDVKSQLVEIKGGKSALVTFSGHVDGAVDGVTTEIDLQGRYTFDIETHCFVELSLEIREKRAASPIGPGLEVTAKLQLSSTAVDASPQLADESLRGISLSVKEAGNRLSYLSQSSAFRMLHARSWHVMDERPEMTILRMVDRGELVAQCNIAVPTVAKSTEPPTLQKFQADVEQALGKSFGQFIQVATHTNDLGNVIHRVVAAGQVAELPIEWHYYLVANRTGKQVILAFTMEQSLVERIADTDQEMADTLELIAPPTAKTATVPQTTK